MSSSISTPSSALSSACETPPIRIGIDLVDVGQVRDSMTTFGARFSERIFSSGERAACTRGGELDPSALAQRFAAKEAAIKAFDLGEAGVGWADIEVVGYDGAAARLRLNGRAARIASMAGAFEIAVTMSVSGDLACAILVAMPARDDRKSTSNNESRGACS